MKAPLTMPVGGAKQQKFDLQRIDYSSAEASGRVAGVQAGFPLWRATWTLTEMTAAKSDEWRSFMLQLRGATRRFLGYDRQRPYPKAYPSGFGGMTRAGGGSFDGSATSWSETITADGDSQVTLHGLPAGFVLSVGDAIGFRWTASESGIAGLTWHAPVRVVIGATADGSGNVTVTSEPPIPSVASGGTAYLDTPKCVMVLVLDQSDLEPIEHRGAIRGGTVAAVQDLRA